MVLDLVSRSIIIFMLASCVTVTKPVPMGDDKYMLSLNARGGFNNNGELLKDSIERANAFCREKGLYAHILQTEVSGVQMWTPQGNQVVFKCLEHK